MKRFFNFAILSLFVIGLQTGCAEAPPEAAPIDVAEAQKGYDDWVSKRIEQIKADSSLSEADKEAMIAEVKESAEGQMGQVKAWASGQDDERTQ